MPTLRIIADATSEVVIDGSSVGTIDYGSVGSFNVAIGDHILSIKCVYHDFLFFRRVIHIEYDQVVEFNFSSMIQDHPEMLDKLELFRFTRNGKIGFFEPITKSIIIQPTYDSCSKFDKYGHSYVSMNGKTGVINKKGERIIQCIYDRIYYGDEGFYTIEKEGLHGLLDSYGNVVVGLFPYEFNKYFHKGRLVGYSYKQDEEYTFKNLEGHIIVKGQYSYLSLECTDERCFIFAHKDDKVAVFDFNGNTIIGLRFNDVSLSNGLFDVRIGEYSWGPNSQHGLYDLNGKVLVPVIYNDILAFPGGFFLLTTGDEHKTIKYDGRTIKDWPYSINRMPADGIILFSDGEKGILYNTVADEQSVILCDNADFFPNSRGIVDGKGYIKIYRNGKYGLVGPMPQCRPVCDCVYDNITEFFNGYACVEQNRRYGAIDKFGHLVIPCKYGMDFFFSKDGYAAVFNYWKNNDGYVIPNDIIDTNDRSVLGFHPYIHVSWSPHHCTRDTHPVISARTKDGKCCIIDFEGNLLGEYDVNFNILSFESVDGFFIANKENDVAKCGWVNRFGKEIIPCKYDKVSSAGPHLLWCCLYGQYALFNDAGRQLTDFCYEEVEGFHDGYSIAKKTSGYGILASSGKELTDFDYDSIDEFFVGHQYKDYDVYDYDSDEEGGVVCTLCAEVEGPFRYGLASVNGKNGNHNHSFIDTKGNPIVLHELGESILSSAGQTHAFGNRSPQSKASSNHKGKDIEYYSKLSGVTYGDRQIYIPLLKEGEELHLERERNNQFDSNALAVHDSVGHHLGYVPKDLAAKVSPLIDQGKTFYAYVTSITGGNGYSYGVNIRICGEV